MSGFYLCQVLKKIELIAHQKKNELLEHKVCTGLGSSCGSRRCGSRLQLVGHY